jgi:hypothetical protein
MFAARSMSPSAASSAVDACSSVAPMVISISIPGARSTPAGAAAAAAVTGMGACWSGIGPSGAGAGDGDIVTSEPLLSPLEVDGSADEPLVPVPLSSDVDGEDASPAARRSAARAT